MTSTTARKSAAAKKAGAEKTAAERAALLDQLATFQDDLDENEILDAKVTIWEQKYSDRNAALIVMQRPEATDIRGYRQWQAEGRQVRKGEKGIRILAPAGQGNGVEAKPAADGQPAVEGKDGRRFFKLISVFDLSQTEPSTTAGPVTVTTVAERDQPTVGELLGSDA